MIPYYEDDADLVHRLPSIVASEDVPALFAPTMVAPANPDGMWVEVHNPELDALVAALTEANRKMMAAERGSDGA